MGKNKKQKNKKYTAMEVDGAGETAPKGKGADYMAVDEAPKQTTRDPLSVKMKPKRGKSSRKQKLRIALKMDKALATSDRSVAKNQKRTNRSSQKQQLKHLWNNRDGFTALSQLPQE